MTIYRVNCSRCTNVAIGDNGGIYCLPTRLNHESCIYIEDGHAGTKDDPDPICCDYFTEDEKQMELIAINW